MADLAWQVVGNISNLSGVTGVFVGGGIASIYQSYCSPSASLKQSEIILNDIKSRLESLSPRRREQIQAALQSETSLQEGPKSLEDLEKLLEDLFDLHTRLTKRYDEVPFIESHRPFTTFRRRLEVLKVRATVLRNDTRKTTVPFIDDIEFDPLVTARPEP